MSLQLSAPHPTNTGAGAPGHATPALREWRRGPVRWMSSYGETTSSLFGIWGALFGAPLAGLLQATALWQELRVVDSGAGQQDRTEDTPETVDQSGGAIAVAAQAAAPGSEILWRSGTLAEVGDLKQ